MSSIFLPKLITDKGAKNGREGRKEQNQFKRHLPRRTLRFTKGFMGFGVGSGSLRQGYLRDSRQFCRHGNFCVQDFGDGAAFFGGFGIFLKGGGVSAGDFADDIEVTGGDGPSGV